MTATLPRKVKTSEFWPARAIVKIGPERTCQCCAEPVAYYHYQHLTGEWVHTTTELVRCDTPAFNIAAPAPTCPKCSSERVTWTQSVWGDTRDCAACGDSAFMSIGD